MTPKTSKFVHVPPARNAVVGQLTEFKWEYLLSNTDSKNVKLVQLSRRSNLQGKPQLVWKVQNNIKFTSQEYANRLKVSVKSRKERSNHQTKRYTFELFNVTLKDGGYYEFKVEFLNQMRNLRNEVFLEVHGKVLLAVLFLSFQLFNL